MTQANDVSANEAETLVFKAARGGGLALGHAEDLAAAARFLDLDGLTQCPCAGDQPPAVAIQTALDYVYAGEGPQTVQADSALIAAFVAAAQAIWHKRLVWTPTPTGAVFERFDPISSDPIPPKGRRSLNPDLAAHLSDMAAKLLVPETETSRAAGAGAGLSDND